MTNKLDWFAGDADALDFFDRLIAVTAVWDDLIDRDKPVSNDQINMMVQNLLLYIPTNPFYRRYEAGMQAHLFSAIVGFQAANRMELSGDSVVLERSHYLRYAVINIVGFMISIIHGIDKGAEIFADASVALMSESLSEYLEEHRHGL